MPVYEYECLKCGKNFEELQSITDKPLKICRFCGGDTRRLISQTSFSLKGSGWYKDGYSTPKPVAESKSPPPEKKPAPPDSAKKVSSKDS
jgi:putative regulatory protein, FmdB family